MDKENAVHIYDGTLFSHTKEGNPATATTWMHLEAIMLSEISQRETHTVRYHL